MDNTPIEWRQIGLFCASIKNYRYILNKSDYMQMPFKNKLVQIQT